MRSGGFESGLGMCGLDWGRRGSEDLPSYGRWRDGGAVAVGGSISRSGSPRRQESVTDVRPGEGTAK